MLMSAIQHTAPRAVFGNAREAIDEPRRRRRAGHDITADDDEAHLHGERDEAPEAVAERLRRLQRRCAEQDRDDRDDDDGERGEDIGVGNPALRPVAAAQRDALELSKPVPVPGVEYSLIMVAHASQSRLPHQPRRRPAGPGGDAALRDAGAGAAVRQSATELRADHRVRAGAQRRRIWKRSSAGSGAPVGRCGAEVVQRMDAINLVDVLVYIPAYGVFMAFLFLGLRSRNARLARSAFVFPSWPRSATSPRTPA